MPAPWQSGSPYRRAWWGVFLTSLAATAVDAAIVFAIYIGLNTRDIPADILRDLVFMGLIVVPASAVGATICAKIIRLRPLKQTLPMFFLLVAIAGFLSIPVSLLILPARIVVPPVMVVSAQLAASAIALSVRRDPRIVAMERPGLCGGCGYSLAGLHRAKTTVCPECGEALPANGVAPASHTPRHPIGEQNG
jgi:FtsH-binding integral membrane protein